LGDGSQGREIDFGVDFGGLGMLVSQDFTNLSQRRSTPEHLGRQGMAKQVSSFVWRMQLCSEESALDHVANGTRTGKAFVRGLRPNEHAATGARRPSFPQIGGQGSAGIGRQR
jgi:hypothetical protein